MKSKKLKITINFSKLIKIKKTSKIRKKEKNE